MAAGLAATDMELAEALFRQGCFDLRNGEELLKGNLVGKPEALAMTQFQQACEKALKAFILLVVGRRVYGRKVKVTHWVWGVDLGDSRLKEPRTMLERLLPDVSALEKLEELVPSRSWEKPNTEYPWVDRHAQVCVPAEYFARAPECVKTAGRTAWAVVKANGAAARFSKTWKAISIVYQVSPPGQRER